MKGHERLWYFYGIFFVRPLKLVIDELHLLNEPISCEGMQDNQLESLK